MDSSEYMYGCGDIGLGLEEFNNMKLEKLPRIEFINKSIKLGNVSPFGSEKLLCIDTKKSIKYIADMKDHIEAQAVMMQIVNLIKE